MRALLALLPENPILWVMGHLLVWVLPADYTVVPLEREAKSCRIFWMALAQGNCGSCAAFSVATLISMRLCLYGHEDFVPSPYRLFDCTRNATCDTGTSIGEAMNTLQRVGITDVAASPQRYGEPCVHEPTRRRFVFSRSLFVHGLRAHEPRQVRALLWLYGPSIGALRTPLARDPESGVYHRSEMETEEGRSHAVVVVGWDAHENWIIHNSWGEVWGDGWGRGRVRPHDILYDVHDPSAYDIYLGCLLCLLGLCVLNLCSVMRALVQQKRLVYCNASNPLLIISVETHSA